MNPFLHRRRSKHGVILWELVFLVSALHVYMDFNIYAVLGLKIILI